MQAKSKEDMIMSDTVEIPTVQVANQDNTISAKEDGTPTSTAIGNNVDMSKYVRQRKTRTIIRENSTKVGRNDPCPCGSGKKYKNCCLKEGKNYNSTRELTAQEMAQIRYGTKTPTSFRVKV